LKVEMGKVRRAVHKKNKDHGPTKKKTYVQAKGKKRAWPC